MPFLVFQNVSLLLMLLPTERTTLIHMQMIRNELL